MHTSLLRLTRLTIAALAAGAALGARADAVTDWNLKTADLVTEARIGTPPAVRLTAIVQTAAYRAARAAQAASAEAAIAAAHRAVLTRLLPAQQAAIDAAYHAALAPLADGPAKTTGIELGQRAAAEVLAQRLDDGATTPEAYRPHTSAGVYVPTAAVAVPQWSQRKPWAMASGAQFRPGPPPALTSEGWLRDFNEVKSLGAKTAPRSAEQTEVARFWEYSLPSIYHGVLRSVALSSGRDLVRNARLFALAAQAMDDAMISVFDAKYHYNHWRPVTAIRNADLDGHDGTQRDASWAPLVDAPMHPEYPSGHSILAGAVGAVLKADLGTQAMPRLSTSSPSAKGATRHWSSVDAFVREVSDARVLAGIHFRSAVDAGAVMGARIGERVVQQEQAEH
ncbi:vanadium-dependent haloperoxidase [Aquincola sp. S2]|uniref:Vanadium-dependent haloperoxidase n=1 Tax=Pseudaquabacterium terrae TaxID=2732868 RepID=A0ABX2EBW8_9BURK|nr:vanadium-dependent haloperoxidase [Aquabacterium terrae]NRF65847.1 vanadium-dependent haloperoxidase [Aquabacterium terrae]